MSLSSVSESAPFEAESSISPEANLASIVEEYQNRGKLISYAVGRVGWSGAEDPEDLVQDAFIGALGATDRFVPNHNGSMAYFLRRSIHNRTIDVVRKRRIQLPVDQTTLGQINNKMGNPEASLEFSENMALLRQIEQSRLEPLVQRAAGYSNDEIAKLHDTSTAVIGQRIFKGRRDARRIVLSDPS